MNTLRLSRKAVDFLTLCQLNDEMKDNLRSKLEEISLTVGAVLTMLDQKKGCLLCEIASIKDLAFELDGLASYYHFRSSLLPGMEGMEEVAKALAALSEKGHGALLAVENNDNLAPYIAICGITGVTIEAKVSAPLLEAIFYPGNPLHDGAVIIREGSIISAGCVFPLSDKKYTSEGQKIGTRHRAAIGLSERTDALVLVVSEETGKVSFVQGGVIHPIEVSLCPNRDSPAAFRFRYHREDNV